MSNSHIHERHLVPAPEGALERGLQKGTGGLYRQEVERRGKAAGKEENGMEWSGVSKESLQGNKWR